MGGMKISELDFLHLLPVFMRDDEAVMALSKAVNELIGEPGKRLSTIRTWDKIDELNEEECDELAWELDVDWYDSRMGLNEKRETLKLAQQIKRKRGTKWAVERLISAYFGEGYVMEWYEAGSAPYTFAVITTSTNVLADNFNKFVNAANAAKNERSHCLGIFYLWEQGPEQGIEVAAGTGVHKYDFKKCGTYPRLTTLGFAIKNTSIETEPEVSTYGYDFKYCGAKSPLRCITLIDIETGISYMVYVSGGKLKMKPISKTARTRNIYFNDIDTAKKYTVYVSGGKLIMNTTTEAAAVNSGLIDDLTTEEPYRLYVSSGKLKMTTA